MTVVQGSEVKLMCSVISDLVPYITWLKHTTQYNGVDDKGNIIDRLFIVKVTEMYVFCSGGGGTGGGGCSGSGIGIGIVSPIFYVCVSVFFGLRWVAFGYICIMVLFFNFLSMYFLPRGGDIKIIIHIYYYLFRSINLRLLPRLSLR